MTGKKSTTPHDAVFKTFLTHVHTARDFLALHLPDWLLRICDLSTLRLTSGSFIEEDLRAYYSDILYSLQTTGKTGYVYVIIEHQSSTDRLMAFRLMRYAIAVMQRHLDAGHRHLPLVIPLLFYHGKQSPWPFSMRWTALFSEPELASRLYGGPFPLVDVTVMADSEIARHRSMAALTLLQKHIRQRDLTGLFERLVTLMLQDSVTRKQRLALINYMIQAGEAAQAKSFIEQLAQRVPQQKEELMTIAEQLKQMGREQGLSEGRNEGRNEGQREARLAIARNMLARGIDLTLVQEVTGLSAADLQQIRH
ncbi:Rpn family recombination-promoting nuclease/putative transposase [Pantoea sp. RRHST58]|uniref:Rpn family recombination-promoting nuclease/putative transposase n=1 Tax=Pantoea sp. RRHST58 TaxID=3425183 RepID=UPI003DA0B7FC